MTVNTKYGGCIFQNYNWWYGLSFMSVILSFNPYVIGDAVEPKEVGCIWTAVVQFDWCLEASCLIVQTLGDYIIMENIWSPNLLLLALCSVSCVR